MNTETTEPPQAQPLQLVTDYQVSPADFLPTQDGQREFPFFTVLETGLDIHEDMPEADWLDAVKAALIAYKTTKETHLKMMFRVGDLLTFGEKKFGERWGQACTDAMAFIMPEKQMARALWVASKVAPDIRREDLSFDHHEALARLDQSEQKKLLTKAATKRWSVGDLKDEIKRLHPPKTRAPKAITTPEEGTEGEEVDEETALKAADDLVAYFAQQEAKMEPGQAFFQDMTIAKRDEWNGKLKLIENLAIRCRRAVKRQAEGRE